MTSIMDRVISVRLTFTDFVLVGILCAVLYGVTVLELQSAEFKKKASGRQITDLTVAATSAFLGIPLSMLCGVVAQSGAFEWDGALVLAPVIAVIAFWVKHHRFGSRSIDINFLSEHVDQYYKRQIVEVVEDAYKRNGKAISVEEVYVRCSAENPPVTILRWISTDNRVKSLRFAMGIDDLLHGLTLEQGKVRELLDSLVTNNLLERGAELDFYAPVRDGPGLTFERNPRGR
jgi:hypothetical protein